ncbi:MAG: HAD-IC family P-type ATPase, partial [Nanoarchaeota archaeon]
MQQNKQNVRIAGSEQKRGQKVAGSAEAGEDKADYHSVQLSQLFSELKTSEKGLSDDEANKRLGSFGYNELKETKKISPAGIFLSQFKSLIVWILIAAVLISMFLKEFVDGAVILAIIFLNALIGFMQEYKADKAIAALKKLVGLRADVLRNGERKQVDARLLVPGDIVFLEMGDKAPADSRLVEEVNLELQESALTGESVPVRKQVCVVERTAQIAERKNMVFSGTTVTKGRAKGVVVKTGMQTEVGRIATLMQETEEPPTPLQKKFDSFGKRIGYATLLISAIVFAVMVVRKGGNVSELLELFKVAVSLAVAAIPEGLPAIVTLTLALGVQKMARRHVLVRNLTSAETLGSVTVICTDKTGTLTVNQMTVRKLYVNDEEINVAGEGYSLKGNVEKVDDSVKL